MRASLILSACIACGDPTVDDLGQTCPPGGKVAVTYDEVPNDAVTSTTVTEQRCGAWWRPRVDAGNATVAIGEGDRCLVLRTYDRVQVDHIDNDPSVRWVRVYGGCETPDGT